MAIFCRWLSVKGSAEGLHSQFLPFFPPRESKEEKFFQFFLPTSQKDPSRFCDEKSSQIFQFFPFLFPLNAGCEGRKVVFVHKKASTKRQKHFPS